MLELTPSTRSGKIAESIRRFGFTNPVLTNQENTIMAGHGRVAAAELIGMDKVPTIRIEHLSPDQIRAYVLADNKLAENAGWDKTILAIELQHLTISSEIPDITLSKSKALLKALSRWRS